MRQPADTPAPDTPAGAAAAAPAKTLPYERGGGTVSVRGFRLLVVLTLVNTALLASMVIGPQLFPFARQQWQSWKDARAEKQRIAARLAAEKFCRNHVAAADRVVYEEDPAEAEKLLKSSTPLYERTPPDGGGGVPPGWVAPAHAVFPAYYDQYLGNTGGQSSGMQNYPLLFLHERTSPSGEKLLVAVHFYLRSSFPRNAWPRNAGTKDMIQFLQVKQRNVVALVSPVGGGSVQNRSAELKLSLPDHASRVIATVEPGQSLETAPAIDYGNVMRFYAGQADPDDASHFTIAYVLDGKPGTIDGWVRDDGLDLRPREGARTYEKEGGEAWKLPATRPATRSGE